VSIKGPQLEPAEIHCNYLGLSTVITCRADAGNRSRKRRHDAGEGVLSYHLSAVELAASRCSVYPSGIGWKPTPG